MKASGLVVSAGLLTAALNVSAQDNAGNAYFWPKFHDQLHYKAKSHAIRGSLTMRRGQQIDIDGKAYQQVVVQPQPEGMPGVPREMFLRADQNGLYIRYSKDVAAPEVLALSLPLQKGKSWTTVDQFGSPSERTIEGIGNCDIKGLTFAQCVRVAFKSPGGAAVAFYAPEYGEIINSRKNGFLRRTINSK